MVRLLANLVLENVICEDSFSNNAIPNEVEDILGGREAATSILKVICDVVLGV